MKIKGCFLFWLSVLFSFPAAAATIGYQLRSEDSDQSGHFYVGLKGGFSSLTHRLRPSDFRVQMIDGTNPERNYRDTVPFLDVSAGVFIAKNVRVDFSYAYHKETTSEMDNMLVEINFGGGLEPGAMESELKLQTYMLSALYEHGGMSLLSIRPYAGLGLGVAAVEDTRRIRSTSGVYNMVRGVENHTVFAAQALAGIVLPLTPHFAVDGGIRFMYIDHTDLMLNFSGLLGLRYTF